MINETQISETILKALEATEIGKPLTINFKGLPVPIDVKYHFSGGWIVEQTLIPGMSLNLTKGEDGHLERLDITMNPHHDLSLAPTT